MTDLVNLRKIAEKFRGMNQFCFDTISGAADRIEQLEARIKELEADALPKRIDEMEGYQAPTTPMSEEEKSLLDKLQRLGQEWENS